ncbi:MAG: NB-ARC domain-containing protein [Mycobacterium sp.]|uniref:NB-ARC domain-containing protein n=1 Tax=Mycobacterium sp. TaxID=1785 RepID=UPI003F9581A1
MTIDGGAVAAYGFRRQYLVAAEEILRIVNERVDDLGGLTLVIEPTRADLGTASDADDDIVDFAIEVGGTVVRRVQVKSSKTPSGMNPLRYSDASSIFGRMGTNAGEAVILTNKPLAKKLLEACGPPTRSPDDQEMHLVVANAITGGASDPVRMVLRDQRSAPAIKQSILAIIRKLRQDHALGPGERSVGLLAALLMDSIFESAADLSPRQLSGEEIKALLCLPDTQTAHALRGFDWGVPLIEVPRLVSAVARTEELTTITELFTESVTTRNPKLVILTGVTGFGKSTIAADFCHLNRHFFEEVCWIDSRSVDLVQARIKDVLAAAGADVASVTDIGAAFQTEMSRRSGPFILVFDGAQSGRDIAPFIPTSGCGLVVVTTNDSTGWAPTATQLHVGSFTEDEATECFEAYAGLEPGVHSDAVRDVVNRLERLPLAIAMAASYFRNADEDISQLSARYFASLEDALGDDSARPDDFDKTAFAAIRFAVSRLGETGGAGSAYKRETQLLVYHSAFFAPELIPLNLVLQTVENDSVTLDLTNPPSPVVASQQRRNAILTNLRTQTIAQRRHYVDASGSSNPASDTISIHPLVHEILRTIHQQAAPHEADLIALLGVFMGCLYGWIIDLRRTGAFFPVEQLLTHGEWILKLVDNITVTDNADSHDVYVFRCAKIFLRAEIANSYAVRGEYQRGVDLLDQVLEEAANVTLTVAPRSMVAKVACDAISDAMLGNLGFDVAARMAQRAIAELTTLEQFTDQPKRGDVIYPFAIQAAQSINSFGTSEARELAEQLAAIANRQNLSKIPDSAVINTIEKSLKSGQFTQALALITSARSGVSALHQNIMFDNFEVIANLHLGRFAAAADGIDRMLAVAGGGTYLQPALRAVSIEVGDALAATRPSWIGKSPRLGAQHAKLIELRAQLDP